MRYLTAIYTRVLNVFTIRTGNNPTDERQISSFMKNVHHEVRVFNISVARAEIEL